MTISQAIDTVTLTKTFNATPKQVYAALTNRDDLGAWLGNTILSNGATVNNPFVVMWNDGNFANCVFTKLEENKAVSYTWRMKNESADSHVDILLDGDETTTLTLHHSGDFADSAAEYEKEWSSALASLVRYVEKGELVDIVDRVIIGIFPNPVSAKRAEELGLEAGQGAGVGGLVPNFSAERAGLQADDIIVAVNGVTVDNSQNTLQVLVRGKKPGESVEVTFYRGMEKMSKSMELKGYPVPAIPNNYAELAAQTQPKFATVFQELSELFVGYSDNEAKKRPAEGEWSALQVLAHLILNEQAFHNQVGNRVTGAQPTGWSGNSDLRLDALVELYPSIEALLNKFKMEMDESLAIMRYFPAETEAEGRKHLWQDAFNMDGHIQHTRGHFRQINLALAAAK